MKVGAKRMFDTPEELANKINEYIDSNQECLTITGLCFYCGFTSRQSFYDYELKPSFTYIIKQARLYIESDYEKDLKEGNKNAAGSIFALKNFGWKDKTEIDFNDISEKTDDDLRHELTQLLYRDK